MRCTGHPRAATEHDAVEFAPGSDGIGVCPVCEFAYVECGMPRCGNMAEYWEVSLPLVPVKWGGDDGKGSGSLLTPYEATPVCAECCPRVASGERPDGIIAVPQIALVVNVEGL